MNISVTTRRRITILFFTIAAGSVDAIVYLAAHVFTANMTGNAVLFGIAAGQRKLPAAEHSLIALLAFIIGIILGAIIVRQFGKSTRWTFVRTAVLLETVLLALFAAMFLLPQPKPHGLTASTHNSQIANHNSQTADPPPSPTAIIL